jgi:hypothetical protein
LLQTDIKPPTPPAIAAPESATCLGCGYALRGLSSRHCPECGRAFDPADPMTMRTPERLDRALRRARWWAPLAAWVATIFVALVLAIFFRFLSPLVIVAMILIAGYVRRVARRSLLAGAVDPNAWSERGARVVTWLLCIYVMINTQQLYIDTCPHGTIARLGPVGVAYSRVGGPCRNTVPITRTWNVGGNWYVWVAHFFG